MTTGTANAKMGKILASADCEGGSVEISMGFDLSNLRFKRKGVLVVLHCKVSERNWNYRGDKPHFLEANQYYLQSHGAHAPRFIHRCGVRNACAALSRRATSQPLSHLQIWLLQFKYDKCIHTSRASSVTIPQPHIQITFRTEKRLVFMCYFMK